jgi:hypothetical protein
MRVKVYFLAVVLGFCLMLFVRYAVAHDHGRPELNEWFKGLRSNAGSYCCDGMDAVAIEGVDWESKDGHYRVWMGQQWIDVPDGAIVNGPNQDGRTMVWPMYGPNGSIGVRCFMPGEMS